LLDKVGRIFLNNYENLKPKEECNFLRLGEWKTHLKNQSFNVYEILSQSSYLFVSAETKNDDIESFVNCWKSVSVSLEPFHLGEFEIHELDLFINNFDVIIEHSFTSSESWKSLFILPYTPFFLLAKERRVVS
jgi:hypothetical protein